MKTLSKPIDGRGFTVLELIIAMSIGLVVLGAVYGALTVQNRHVLLQEQLAEMQWNARTAMEIMMRDIRMAGYNPQGSVWSGIQPGITAATAQTLGFVADLNGNGSTAPDSSNPNENVGYAVYNTGGVFRLGRTVNGSTAAMARNVESWTFSYYDRDGNLLSSSPAVSAIHRIRVNLTVRTEKSDPSYTDPSLADHYRRYTLDFNVFPRNIGI